MSDQVEYETPLGPLGALAEKLWLGKHLDDFFHYRQKEAKRISRAGDAYQRVRGV